MASEEISVTCAACGAPMVERENRINGSTFLGCSRFPECKETSSVPAWLSMKRAGGMELPGYDVAAVSGLTIEARRGGDATEAEDRATARLVAAAPLMHAALEAEEAAQWYYAASIGGLLDEYGRELCKRADQLRREALAASRPPELSEARRGTEQ